MRDPGDRAEDCPATDGEPLTDEHIVVLCTWLGKTVTDERLAEIWLRACRVAEQAWAGSYTMEQFVRLVGAYTHYWKDVRKTFAGADPWGEPVGPRLILAVRQVVRDDMLA